MSRDARGAYTEADVSGSLPRPGFSVLHVSFSKSGGAGRFAAQLNTALNDRGIASSHAFVSDGGAEKVAARHPIAFLSALIDLKIVKRSDEPVLFTLLRGKVSTHAPSQQPDIVHVHWSPGCLSLRELNALASTGSALVWTMHDMWPITGGCHHSGNCDLYKTKCDKCPQVRGVFRKSVAREHDAKVVLHGNTNNSVLVAPARWLYDAAVHLSFGQNRVVQIPTFIDIGKFQAASPVDRAELGLCEGDRTVVFVAANLDDPNKGLFSFLDELARNKQGVLECRLKVLLVGKTRRRHLPEFCLHVDPTLNNIGVERLLRTADVFVGLSSNETFPTVVLESMASGIPVVCLNNAGYRELIDDCISGRLFENLTDLVDFLLSDEERFNAVASYCGSAAMRIRSFSQEVVTDAYTELYHQVIASGQ